MLVSLRQTWDEAVEHLIADLISSAPAAVDGSHDSILATTSDTWYKKIQTYYNEPHRAYHNWTHVQDVLASLDFLLNNQQQMRVTPFHLAITTLAAFFHDVVYDPKSTTNEKDSATLFEEFVAALSIHMTKEPNDSETSVILNSEVATKVIECIIASATHISSSMEANQTNNVIVAIFLDADISILGKPSNEYEKYAGCIRKEYIFVERDVYCNKRAEILEGFLPLNPELDDNLSLVSKKRHHFVFATEIGRSEWEENARCNLKREIECLKRGVIPCEDE